jgi:hypothetical protein
MFFRPAGFKAISGKHKPGFTFHQNCSGMYRVVSGNALRGAHTWDGPLVAEQGPVMSAN